MSNLSTLWYQLPYLPRLSYTRSKLPCQPRLACQSVLPRGWSVFEIDIKDHVNHAHLVVLPRLTTHSELPY